MMDTPPARKPQKDTFFDTLFPMCPPSQDVDLPGDGSKKDIGIAVLLFVAIAVVGALVAAVLLATGATK